jgi:hypothetical protein
MAREEHMPSKRRHWQDLPVSQWSVVRIPRSPLHFVHAHRSFTIETP